MLKEIQRDATDEWIVDLAINENDKLAIKILESILDIKADFVNPYLDGETSHWQLPIRGITYSRGLNTAIFSAQRFEDYFRNQLDFSGSSKLAITAHHPALDGTLQYLDLELKA